MEREEIRKILGAEDEVPEVIRKRAEEALTRIREEENRETGFENCRKDKVIFKISDVKNGSAIDTLDGLIS